MQIELIVLLGVKTNGAVAAALNDVPGNAGYEQACSARHGEYAVVTQCRSLSEITVVCPLLSLRRESSSPRNHHFAYIRPVQH